MREVGVQYSLISATPLHIALLHAATDICDNVSDIKATKVCETEVMKVETEIETETEIDTETEIETDYGRFAMLPFVELLF